MDKLLSFRRAPFAGLLLVLVFLLFWRLGSSPIYILDEAKNAQCAKEMMQRNDWVVPTFNEELRTDKPVLHYYFMIVAYKLFGVSAFSARFFSAIFGVLTVLITFLFVKRFANPLTAFCSALVLTASSHFLFEFRLSVPDPYLIFFTTAGLFSAYTYLQRQQFIFIMAAALAFALATLSKGPVALLLPGLSLLIWVFLKKKWKAVFNWKLVAAIALFILVALPWYLAVDKATNGEWTKGFFLDHNINRFASPKEGHGGFFLVTVLFVLVGMLPFVFYTGEVIKNKKTLFKEDLVKFSAIVVLVYVVFFSISSTRLPNYPMPCYPFAAIIFGHYLEKLLSGKTAFKTYPQISLLVFLFLVPIAAWIAVRTGNEINYEKRLLAILIIPALLFLFILLRKNSSGQQILFSAIACYLLFNSFFLHYLYPATYKQNPVTQTIHLLQGRQQVFAYKNYNPGYNFYIEKPITRFHDTTLLRKAMEQAPGAILITRQEYEDELSSLQLKRLAEHKDLFEIPTTVIYEGNR